MTTQLNNLGFYVNGDQIPYEADTLEWTSGFGEYMVRNVVVGGSITEQVFSEDIKTKLSDVKVSLPSTIANVENLRKWKTALNTNTVEIIGTIDGKTISQIFTQASVTNDPTTQAATEGSIDFEFKSNPAQ